MLNKLLQTFKQQRRRWKYETGSITNLDLLDAVTAESAAKLMNLQALYRLVISKYDLDRAIGASLID